MSDDAENDSFPLWMAGAAALVALGIIAAGGADARGRGATAARGRLADSPADIPVRGWKDILVRTYHSIGGDRVVETAGGVTFFVLLAFFPMIGALVSIYGLFADPAEVSRHVDLVAGILPGGGIDILREQATRVAAQSKGALGLGFALSLGLSLWSANSGMKALFDALNVAYGEKERRGFFKLNTLSLTFTIGAIALMLIALGAIVVAPIVLGYLQLGGARQWLFDVLRWPAMLLIVMFALSLVYRFGPDRDQPRWKWITWGSAVAAVLWLAVSLLFSWYAANFGSYNKTYGSLGAAVGFMTWIWLSTIVVLMGAELNAEIEHQTARDTTVGGRRPIGFRGAKMADRIGPAQAA